MFSHRSVQHGERRALKGLGEARVLRAHGELDHGASRGARELRMHKNGVVRAEDHAACNALEADDLHWGDVKPFLQQRHERIRVGGGGAHGGVFGLGRMQRPILPKLGCRDGTRAQECGERHWAAEREDGGGRDDGGHVGVAHLGQEDHFGAARGGGASDVHGDGRGASRGEHRDRDARAGDGRGRLRAQDGSQPGGRLELQREVSQRSSRRLEVELDLGRIWRERLREIHEDLEERIAPN